MLKYRDDLTFEHVYKVLTYDCFTGEIRRSDNPDDLGYIRSNLTGKYRGKVAGTIQMDRNTSYVLVGIKGKQYLAHRLAWLMTYERWPNGDIDHIDGNGLNNAISNLREVTRSENNRNFRLVKKNTSGVCGVFWDKGRRKFAARIKMNGKNLFLGRFNTLEEAAAARQKANEQYGFHTLHGTVKNG